MSDSGLILSQQTRVNSSAGGVLYVKKDAPVLSSPLTIEGQDGSVQIQAVDGAIVLGENDLQAGQVVQVNGPDGLGTVYDTVYNKPAGWTLAREFNTYVGTFADGTTFSVESDGLYCIQTSISVDGTALGGVVSHLNFGDGGHSAVIVNGSDNRATIPMIDTVVGGYNNLRLQTILPLSSSTYVANQPYKIMTYAGDYPGNSGTLNVKVYRICDL